MTALAEIGSLPLGGINIAIAGAIPLLNPLLAAFDLTLTGPFGLGALQADLSLTFNAALSVQVSLGLSLSNPLDGLLASLQAIAQLTASLQASIALGLPSISADISLGISASLAVTAALGLQLGGISALLELALSVKIPVINLIADLTAALSAGPVVLLSFGFPGDEPLASVGAQCAAMFGAGLTGIAPTDGVAGIIMVTKTPAAKLSMGVLFQT